MPSQMHLAFDLSWTHMGGRWRMPGSWVGSRFPDIRMYEEIARIAERGCIDMIFFGDGSGIPDTWRGSFEEAVRWGIMWPRQDMSPWIAAMSRVTEHVGFGLTYASTFMHPYYTARLLNSLDILTNGRIAFNVVTSTRLPDAANYGFDELMDHGARYDRMEEFIDVCRALWDSVEPDTFLWDDSTGIVADPSKLHRINHDGPYFKVRGPLNTMPSPQGRPVLIQAGGSPRGIKASAHVADHVFGAHKPLKLQMQQRAELDAALAAAGRDPDQVGILWDVLVNVGETSEAARIHKDRLLTAIPLEGAGAFLSQHAGYDFSTIPDRFTLGELNALIAAKQASPVGFVHQLAFEIGDDVPITRKDFFEHGMREASGHKNTIAGDAREVADAFEDIFEATGSRGGFMIAHPQSTPRDLINVVDFLVPELRRRGRFRDRYTGTTLRQNLAVG